MRGSQFDAGRQRNGCGPSSTRTPPSQRQPVTCVSRSRNSLSSLSRSCGHCSSRIETGTMVTGCPPPLPGASARAPQIDIDSSRPRKIAARARASSRAAAAPPAAIPHRRERPFAPWRRKVGEARSGHARAISGPNGNSTVMRRGRIQTPFMDSRFHGKTQVGQNVRGGSGPWAGTLGLTGNRNL